MHRRLTRILTAAALAVGFVAGAAAAPADAATAPGNAVSVHSNTKSPTDWWWGGR